MPDIFTLGQHAEAIRKLQTDMNEVKTDIKTILSIVDQRRGERRVTLWVVSGVSAAVSGALAFIAKVLP